MEGLTLRNMWAKEDIERTQHLWLQLLPHTVCILKSDRKITGFAAAVILYK